MKDVLKEVEQRMVGAVEAFQSELASLRTGRASLALVDGITVDYYGSQTPLNQVAALSVPDPTTIAIAPWEPKVLAEVEKAILRSNLGLTPNNDGKVVRLNIPPLTEERRRELVKVAHDVAETSRNEIRQVRRDGNDKIKNLEKAKQISEDQMHDGQDQVQKLTDTYVEKVNTILKKKEEEVMEV
ncbi:MAG: ribosome recycling factor [Acidobacteria bacterium]|jgi:ribosome recycling factor|nr:ribosome recycling factor [Acidobacteriota bacterium]